MSSNSIKYSLSIFILLNISVLTGCQLQKQPTAPITDLNSSKISQSEQAKKDSNLSSSSYPLPEPPIIETVSSYSVDNPDFAVGKAQELIISPESEIVLTSLAQANNQDNQSQINQSNKGIASNSPLIVKTPRINYVAKEGEPNWQKMSFSAIKALLESDNGLNKLSGTLYVGSVSNQSNSTLPVYIIDQLLTQISSEHTPFSVISQSKINEAKQQLNIPANDSLITTSKTLAIAKAMDASYILFSSIIGDGDSTTLSLQLIDTSTAEILGQGIAPIEY